MKHVWKIKQHCKFKTDSFFLITIITFEMTKDITCGLRDDFQDQNKLLTTIMAAFVCHQTEFTFYYLWLCCSLCELDRNYFLFNKKCRNEHRKRTDWRACTLSPKILYTKKSSCKRYRGIHKFLWSFVICRPVSAYYILDLIRFNIRIAGVTMFKILSKMFTLGKWEFKICKSKCKAFHKYFHCNSMSKVWGNNNSCYMLFIFAYCLSFVWYNSRNTHFPK